jgi:biopolymer transport protein TolR
MSARKQGRRLMGQINVVPYIDVMLVLLIIFMITAPLLQQGVTVDLPQADAEPLDSDDLQSNEPLIISMDAEGQVYINLGDDPEAPVSVEQVQVTTRAVLNRNAETPIYLNADGGALHEQVISVYVRLQQAGATKIGILTDPIDRSQI